MELLDIYDNKGKKLDYSKSREEAHRDGLWHKIACIFVVNSENQIIMQKSISKVSANDWKWNCSASGHIDAGEDTITGALRELYEEIGVAANKDELKHIGTVFEDYDYEDLKINHIAEIFMLRNDISISSLKFQEEEVSGAKYFSIKDIESMPFAEKHKEIFRILKQEVS